MNEQEIRWLTWGATQMRPHGAPKWDEPGTLKAISDHCGTWDLGTATEHVLAHARDPKARTPLAIRGTAPLSTAPERLPYSPPKSENACVVHPGEWVGSCRICRGPRVVDEEPGDRPARPRPATTDQSTHVAEARRLLAEGANA